MCKNAAPSTGAAAPQMAEISLMSHEKITLVLQSARMVTPRVRELAFVRKDGEPFPFVPGQFITLLLPYGDMLLRRSYSVATRPGEGDALRVAITDVEGGRATGLLFALEPGDEVEGTGPYGRLTLRDDDPDCRYVFVATGTGVSPYRAMLGQLAERLDGKTHTAVVMLGVRGPHEALYAQDFLHFAEANEHLSFLACYSRVMPDQPAPHERKGYVQDALDELELDPAKDILYLCGNPEMIDAAAEMAKALGFPTTHVRREKYVSSN